VSLTVDVDGPVVTLTLRRPQRRNAIDHALFAALTDAFAVFERDPTARVLVVTGEGSAFCAGMDLAAFAQHGPIHDPGADSWLTMDRTKPAIAAVNGPAIAAGFELVLTCDLAIASETATFGLPEVRRGLVATAGTWRLARAIGTRPALELALTGETIDAARARTLGLVTRVVAPQRLGDATRELAQRLAECPPAAVTATLQLTGGAFDRTPAQSWASALQAADGLLASDDARERARTFVERRPPRG
jgi:enoyl-CoA hydratase/carnithine racemase